MYLNGQGVAQSFPQAAAWTARAAAQGNTSAQFNLGLMYANGQGVAQDPVAACALLTLASTVAGPDRTTITSYRSNLASNMTPKQLDESQALITEIGRVGMLQALHLH